MGPFDSIAALRPYAIWKGAVARAMNGERLTVAVVDLDPDLLVPEHSMKTSRSVSCSTDRSR
jgi:hypothetical protein